MKKKLFPLLLLSSSVVFSGCEFVLFMLETPDPKVCITYDWWNNLINVPVIEGSITNQTGSTIYRTTIGVETYNCNNECMHTTQIVISQEISDGCSFGFKEWISGSDEACNVKATVVSYN